MITYQSYTVRKTKSVPDWNTINSASTLWDNASEISEFIFPWQNDTCTASMSFKAVHDEQWVYWKFSVQDEDIKIFVDKNDKSEVILGDRVEIFFSQDLTLSSYYCLEIDFLSRVYDYHASHYRKFDSQWQWPREHLRVKGEKNHKGYDVVGSVSVQSLTDYGLLKNKELITGLYRGKCMDINGEAENMKWISWVKPQSATPDFHIPSSFGLFTLE